MLKVRRNPKIIDKRQIKPLFCQFEIDWVSVPSILGYAVSLLMPIKSQIYDVSQSRYYGESMPYGSKEEAYKNATTLAHLTAEQAFADYAVLITNLKRNLPAQASPIVLFGGSYAGMLAAWMRLKYPHIAIGALASSAPGRSV